MKINRFQKAAIMLLCLGFSATSLFGCSSRKASSGEIKVRHKKIEETEEIVTPVPTETDPTIPDPTEEPPEPLPTEVDDSKTINVFCYASDYIEMCETYKELHPDFEYEFVYTEIAYTGGTYDEALKAALKANDSNTPDIIAADIASADTYINGEYSSCIAGYDEFGIDIDAAVEEAGIAQHVVDLGTRESDGKIVALEYQSDVGVMIYRADIAEEVFGTSDPDAISEICGGNSGSLTKLLAAGDKLVGSGYALCSGPSDLWFLYDFQDQTGWFMDGEAYISEQHEQFFDFADTLYANNYTNKTQPWYTEWFDDMMGKGEREVFAFFEPDWFLEYTMEFNAPDTAGLWRITDSPVNFWYGGTWTLATKHASEADEAKKEAIADFLTWALLDTSPDGWQYMVATEDTSVSLSQPVTSSVVMEQVTMESDYLGGQDKAPIYLRANESTQAGMLENDSVAIGTMFVNYVQEYAEGNYNKADAVSDFLDDAEYYVYN